MSKWEDQPKWEYQGSWKKDKDKHLDEQMRRAAKKGSEKKQFDWIQGPMDKAKDVVDLKLKDVTEMRNCYGLDENR